MTLDLKHAAAALRDLLYGGSRVGNPACGTSFDNYEIAMGWREYVAHQLTRGCALNGSRRQPFGVSQ